MVDNLLFVLIVDYMWRKGLLELSDLKVYKVILCDFVYFDYCGNEVWGMFLLFLGGMIDFEVFNIMQ